jgi:hypothetical protein
MECMVNKDAGNIDPVSATGEFPEGGILFRVQIAALLQMPALLDEWEYVIGASVAKHLKCSK